MASASEGWASRWISGRAEKNALCGAAGMANEEGIAAMGAGERGAAEE